MPTNLDPKFWYHKLNLNTARRPLARRINEFGKVWDFEGGHAWPNFVKTQRETLELDIPTDLMDIDTPLTDEQQQQTVQYNTPNYTA